MNARYCLIIDDTDQKDEIAQLEALSKQRGFPIKCHYFNPTSRECLREEILPGGGKDFVLDLEKIYEELQKKFSLEKIHFIATDYNLTDKAVNGVEIVRYLKEKNWRGKIPFVIFSGDIDEINKSLQDNVRGIIDNADLLKNYLESYSEKNPNKIFRRKAKEGEPERSYIEDLYAFIKSSKTSLNVKLSTKLGENSEHVFKNIFPGFNGKKLKELSQLVTQNTADSDTFENEFIDRSVDHFIYLKEQ